MLAGVSLIREAILPRTLHAGEFPPPQWDLFHSHCGRRDISPHVLVWLGQKGGEPLGLFLFDVEVLVKVGNIFSIDFKF